MGGIIVINRADSSETEEIRLFVNSLTNNMKNSDSINRSVILKQSLKQNSRLTVLIFFLGCTLLGSFLIYGVIFYKGFSLGYTVSAIVATLGAKSRKLVRWISIGVAKCSFFASNIYVIL